MGLKTAAARSLFPRPGHTALPSWRYIAACLTGLTVLCLLPASPAWAAQRHFRIAGLIVAADDGRLLGQKPASGSLVLQGDGSYRLSSLVTDQGNYQYSPARSGQPRNMILFRSNRGWTFFAFVESNRLMIWLRKDAAGRNLYLAAQPVAAPSPARGGAALLQRGQVPAISGGRFSATVLYAATSAPWLYYRNRSTGALSADEKGIILRTDGTYYLRVESGKSVITAHGGYQITGNQVLVRFKDGSSLTFTLENQRKSLKWYGAGGVIISEYTFMGVLP